MEQKVGRMSDLVGKLIDYAVVEVCGKRQTYTVTFDRNARIKHGYRHEPKANQTYLPPEQLPPTVKQAAAEVYAQRFKPDAN